MTTRIKTAARVTKSGLARHLGVSPQAVSQAVKVGRVTPGEDGLFDLAEATAQWKANTHPARDSDYSAARTRRESALASLAEIQLARESGDLIPREVVDFVLADFGSTVRSLLENLPDRLTPLLHGRQDISEIHAIIAQSADEVLGGLAAKMAARAA